MDLSQFNGIQRKVAHLLTKHKDARDSDELLTAMYWWNELKDLNFDPREMKVPVMLRLLANRQITLATSITRARQKLQQHYPEFRGDNWEIRQEKKEECREYFRGIQGKLDL